MQSKATTVEQYLAELPEDRRATIEAVRKMILANIDEAYEEGMQYGMIGYYVPHRLYPAGYHTDPKQPLPFLSLASQKNHLAIYMSCTCNADGDDTAFREAWKKTGKKLDLGKSCLRFKKVEDLALDLIGDTIKAMPVNKYIDFYESTLKDSRKRTKETTPAKTKKPATKAGH